jgi:hypothetical protein
MIAAELGKTEDDVAHWSIQRIIDWAAFFKLRGENIQRGMPRVPEKFTKSGVDVIVD